MAGPCLVATSVLYLQWIAGGLRQAAGLAVVGAAAVAGAARAERGAASGLAGLRRRAAGPARRARPAAAHGSRGAQWHPGAHAHCCHRRYFFTKGKNGTLRLRLHCLSVRSSLTRLFLKNLDS